MTRIVKPIDGVLHLIAYDQQGRELWSLRQSNQIVNGAYEIAAEALAGLPNAAISKVAAGTNGTEPTESDTSITDPTIVDVQTVEYPAPDTVRFNFTFGYMDAAGKSIAEFGLLTIDGRLFARKVRQPIEKTEYMIIKGSWEITGAMSLPNTPSGSPLHDLFVAAGAVWDTSSKSWTVGAVTGISNSVMTKIYSLSHNVLNNSNWDSVLESTYIPVNLPPRKSPSRTSSSIQTTARSTFRASNFKTIYLCPKSQFVRFSDCSQLFYGCQQLVTIIGGITFENTANNLAFTSCKSLQDVRFNLLRYNIDLRDSPLLTLESFQYLVENATNTSDITVTVHADVYAKLTDPQQSDWYAINTAAQAKKISFATA